MPFYLGNTLASDLQLRWLRGSLRRGVRVIHYALCMPDPTAPKPKRPPDAREPGPRNFGRPETGWRLQTDSTIFEADSRAGRWFDPALIAAIVLSLVVPVMGTLMYVVEGPRDQL